MIVFKTSAVAAEMKESHGIKNMISKNHLIDWMREFKMRRYRERESEVVLMF